MRGARHSLLREATANIHAAVDRAVETSGYFAARAPYEIYLRRLHLFHVGFEGCVRAAAGPVADIWRLGARTAWLADDIERLGGSPYRPSAAAGFRRPRIDGVAGVMGALYVVLGASLGARMLVRRVGGLGLPAGGGQSYLTSLAAADDWPRFLASLEQAPALSEQHMLEAAVATFESVLDHMTGAIPA